MSVTERPVAVRCCSRVSRPVVIALFWFCPTVSVSADYTVQFEVIARTEATAIPAGQGKFTGLGPYPAIDSQGNVVFTGGGANDSSGRFQAGVYTRVGACCQKVADRNTLVPGGGGIVFDGFAGLDMNDIDDGRVAFRADIEAVGTVLGVYSNVGQASANTLVKVAVANGQEWSRTELPWVDGDFVGMLGDRFGETETLLWDGVYDTDYFADPGPGYSLAMSSQAALSGDAVLLRRYNAQNSQLVVAKGGSYEVIGENNVTPMPGPDGGVFSNFSFYPVIDRDGLDVAFAAYGTTGRGIYKRVDGGALQEVADQATAIPGAPGWVFSYFGNDQVALAGRQVVFLGFGQSFTTGVYTDIGGQLSSVVDTLTNNFITLNGQLEEIIDVNIGNKSFAMTPDGYELVFWAKFATGQSAILKATITEGQGTSGQFTVRKDFSDNSTASVSVTASCTSGTVTNNPQWAREGFPAVFQITGASAGTTCTAVENSVPPGYTKNESDCQNGDPLNGSCTIVNTAGQSSGTFTVRKDFSDNNTVWVRIDLNCTSGTITTNPIWAREGTPAVFTITGAAPGTTCRAVESAVPAGYTKNESDCQNGDPLNGSCTIVNTFGTASNTFTVYKDFSDNSTASVSVSASCSSGTVTNNPQLASEAAPAVFIVSGATAGATCTAVENGTPAGYSKNESDCQNGDPLNGSCTLVNTRITSSNTFTVYKDFSDNSTASVSVSASCSSGSVTNNPQFASEASPAVFTVSGATAGTTCTAVENATPAGYTRNEADCQSGRPLNGSCILVNTRLPTAQLQDVAYDGFEDGNANGWTTSGSVDVNSQTAVGQYALRLRKSSSAVLSVSTAGFSGVSITMRLAGSSLESGDACFAEYSTNGGGTWATLLQVDNGDPDGSFLQGTASPAAASNNSNLRLRFRSTGGQPNDICWGDEVRVRGTASTGTAGSFVVRKDFSDNNTAGVSVSLACTSGTVTNSPRSASEASPAVFYIQGQSAGATCSAFESVPAGYTANQSGCQDGDPVNGACTIINTPGGTTNGTFTVRKDFSDNSTAAVTFTATCSSGTVTNSPRQATESSPAVFNVTGASPGTTCTAAEPTTPSGYTRNQSDCQNAKPLNGSCTIINTLNTTPQEVDILYATFEDGQAGGWSTGANVSVDTAVAIGQYALHLRDDGAVSTRAISTAGYSGVNVSVRMAATSLQGSDSCFAEYSTNGGGTWSTLLEVSNGSADGTFATGTTATASASNNPNFRLRFRLIGKGRGDHCYGDEIRVRGTP